MKHLVSVVAFSALLLSACGHSSKEESPPAAANESAAADTASPAGEPITLHARFDFTDALTSTSIGASRQLKTSIYLEADVLRQGSGASATYALDKEVTRVQGVLHASGSLALKDNDVSSSETYNMQNAWTTLTENPEGKYEIILPEASHIGEGLSVGVAVEVPVTGVKKATISSKDQTMDSDITHARSLFCQTQTPEKDICKLAFSIDAVPTKAQSPLYESMFENAKKVYEFQGKKDANGGLIMYSGMVPVFGATTEYHDGQFVTELNQQYSEKLDGSDITQHIHLVVWSTPRGDKWEPKGLPPLQQ